MRLTPAVNYVPQPQSVGPIQICDEKSIDKCCNKVIFTGNSERESGDEVRTANPARILVVDDEAAMARLAVAVLRRHGHSAAAVQNAEEAIFAVSATPPDLAIVDVRMPGMSGLALGAILRDRFSIPFVYLTADDSDTVSRATDLGAIAYLVKPIEMTQLVPAIESALARARDLARVRSAESNLEKALGESRAIGVAVGVLMERLRVDRVTAFELLRDDARDRRHRICEVAAELLKAAETMNGVLGGERQALKNPPCNVSVMAMRRHRCTPARIVWGWDQGIRPT